MQNISATIITRNEEQNIERCLNALQGVADEIIVVDSYSTDRTLEICKRYGCKITSREFRGFGSQRQYATGLTKHAYVLSIDADEMIDDDLRQSLIRLKEKGFDHRIYSITVKTYFCGEPLLHSGFEPESHVRLFNKRYANWNLRDVSDSVSYPDSLQPALLSGAIHHYRCSTIEEFVKKENRIAALESKVIATNRRNIRSFMPWIMATRDYIISLLIDSAWLDGQHGLTIAKRRAKTTLEAYKMARKILKDQAKQTPGQ